MTRYTPFVGDTGTDILLDTQADITGATVSIKVIKPNGPVVIWDATPYALHGTTTYVRHTTVTTDFDVPGRYRVQPQIALADGSWSGRGGYAEFDVLK